jgi:hypothetical protein
LVALSQRVAREDPVADLERSGVDRCGSAGRDELEALDAALAAIRRLGTDVEDSINVRPPGLGSVARTCT